MSSVKNIPNQRYLGNFLGLGCNRYWYPQIKISLRRCFLKYENQKKLKNCGDDYSMDLLYGGHLGDTIISGNTDLIVNIILEIRYLVLSYLHIGLPTH